ncbi:50S ribosomal protein L29 [Thermocladium modestius]|uniref:Large ribosomal subunit protein uL29 n=1 Tax=Thermocladium modestius TaxID=62609 RepID=A0A830GVG0_9CREN|nr:50S ribosomal protein L29 [Thermocladium modestius]GGP20920.1 50S ribosomal protein L29 [Thermocladium modestius]
MSSKQRLNSKYIRSLSKEDRERLLGDLLTEVRKLRAQAGKGVVENPGRLRTVRKAIARILTIKREEELKTSRSA